MRAGRGGAQGLEDDGKRRPRSGVEIDHRFDLLRRRLEVPERLTTGQAFDLVLVGGLPARGRDHIGQARASSRTSSWGSRLRASAAKEARRICCNKICELLSHNWHDSSEKQPADGVHVSRQSVRFLLENFRRHVAARAHTFDHLPATITRHTVHAAAPAIC